MPVDPVDPFRQRVGRVCECECECECSQPMSSVASYKPRSPFLPPPSPRSSRSRVVGWTHTQTHNRNKRRWNCIAGVRGSHGMLGVHLQRGRGAQVIPVFLVRGRGNGRPRKPQFFFPSFPPPISRRQMSGPIAQPNSHPDLESRRAGWDWPRAPPSAPQALGKDKEAPNFPVPTWTSRLLGGACGCTQRMGPCQLVDPVGWASRHGDVVVARWFAGVSRK
ncbi:uncharacterized protein B0H64DRAFT_47572 [Chaetomium fimeti]|uniref:Uncharacterized protein n=1 Tax=Chaetomium fimeti TaxID=1854472 RepID=A0AAE0LNQ3_9PEZI|nr:hypothetical protein B0H64DRAFT_47572 [Chaetomium fimeti]